MAGLDQFQFTGAADFSAAPVFVCRRAAGRQPSVYFVVNSPSTGFARNPKWKTHGTLIDADLR